MVSPRKRTVWKAAAIAVAVACVATTAHAQEQQVLSDREGLQFTSSEAFCGLHCKPWRRNRALNQCSQEQCPQYHTTNTKERRQLEGSQGAVHAEDNRSSSKLKVLSCGDGSLPSHINFEIDSDATNDASEMRTVLSGFHDAFFRAFDAMIVSSDAATEACQLQWLQQDLLSASASTELDPSSTQPMLVKLDPHSDQRLCVASVKQVWTDVDEAVTPFLSRVDQSQASATVLLLHIDQATATQLTSLDCVSSVQQLPSILKLLPFARSAFQLSNRESTTAPGMWIRVLKGSDPQEVYTRLQSKLASWDGVTNVFELPERPELFPRGVFIKPVQQLELWAHAVALAIDDAEVEWVDAKQEIALHTLRTHETYPRVPSRRLDEYVESLVGVEPAQQQGIRGDGVIVGITDSGLYINHDQFDQTQRDIYDQKDMAARKVVYYNAWADAYDQSAEGTCGHGTHVAGLLAGSSFSGKASNLGIASNAKIAFMDIGTQSGTCLGQDGCEVGLATPADASQLLQSQMEVGAKIFSFSWGTPGSDYSVQARDLDAFIYNNPEILIVVAAGNSGEDSANGQGTISSPSGAKNVISVGASLNAAESFKEYSCPSAFNPGSVASFSSAGPTTDGRMKPDVVAPGMSLISSRSERPGATTKSLETCSLQGTSQATPVVTGIAVLLYQWLRDGWWKAGVKDEAYGMATIPAALLKALIIHSGDSLQRRLDKFPSGPVSCAGIESMAWGLTYPDVYQGYGKPNMSNIAEFTTTGAAPTLYFLPNSTVGSEPSVGHQKEVRISFTVPRGVDLRATLVWTDPAGSMRATTQLQHDLDLTVQIRNSTKMFYPLTADNTTKRDEKNNVEMIVVSYQQLLDALAETTQDGAANGSTASMLGPDGEIIVEAIVYGRSVLLADSQAFAFVASSSVIGSTSGVAAQDKANSSKSFWTPWTIGGVGACALVLLALLTLCVRCCTSTKHRRPPGAAATRVTVPIPVNGVQYHPYHTPAGTRHGGQAGLETCPYCAYACNDPVVMVNHVENMHEGVNGPPPHTGSGFGLPPTVHATPPGVYPGAYPPPYGAPPVSHHAANTRPDERCPFCPFASSDAVILVNHVEHLHGQQRVV